MSTGIEIPKDKIAAFCQRNHIRRLALFGSVLREDFGTQSDVDVLVEFEPGHTPGLSFFTMQREVSEIDRSTMQVTRLEATRQSVLQ